MNNGLKIYACSGIGATEINSYQYWMAGSKDYENSPAVNTLLAMINEANVELIYIAKTDLDKVALFNKIDFLIVCLVLAKSGLANEQKATVIQHMYNSGDFDLDSMDDLEREEYLSSLIAKALEDQTVYEKSGDFYKWFLTEIAERNTVLFSPEQQKKIAAAINSVSGIGAADYGSLTEYIENSGQYFLYRFIPENKRSGLSTAIKNKIKKQDEFYQYVLQNWAPAYGTKADLDRVIRMNIISNCKTTPEKAVEALLDGEGVGVLTEAAAAAIAILVQIMEILVAVAAIVSSFIPLIIKAIEVKATAKYAVPTNIESGCPAAEDWPEAEEKARKYADGNGLLKIGIIGALLLLILKK